MTISSVIQTLLCIVVIYALLSIMVSLLNEFYRSLVNSRGKVLYAEVRKLLKDHFNVDYGYLVYTHPIINKLPRASQNEKPGWIEPKTFATAVIHTFADLDITLNKNSSSIPVTDRFIGYLNTMNDSKLRNLLTNFYDASGGNYEKLELRIMEWFENHMAALTVDYKRRQRKGLGFFAIVVTLFLNLDSIYMLRRLIFDSDLRQQISSQASPIYNQFKPVVDQMQTKYPADTSMAKNAKELFADLQTVKRETDSLGLPLGWSWNDAPGIWLTKQRCTYPKGHRNRGTFWQWIWYIAGLIISVVSLSRGAPFWFEILGKFVTIKRGGSKS